MQDIFEKLAQSPFRSKFRLKETDIKYIQQKGLDTIESHAVDFIKKRIAPAEIQNEKA